ncbi:MAG: PilZ domain-containing protein [Desulfobacula sp.]|nr:PilZ domain-containing protein [Desulfobacula sp.]
MAVSDNDERRRHARVDFATPILIQIEADGEKIDVKGSTSDLSLKGIFIGTQNILAVGTKCSIKIFLTGTRDKLALLMEGSIVRSNENGMGIEFMSMDVDTYSHLKNIVNYNSLDNSI